MQKYAGILMNVNIANVFTGVEISLTATLNTTLSAELRHDKEKNLLKKGNLSKLKRFVINNSSFCTFSSYHLYHIILILALQLDARIKELCREENLEDKDESLQGSFSTLQCSMISNNNKYLALGPLKFELKNDRAMRGLYRKLAAKFR